MSPVARLLIGLVSTGMFLTVGVWLFAEGRPILAGLTFAFGLFRGFVLVRQAWAMRPQPDDDEE